jgi:CBS domain-containing protein
VFEFNDKNVGQVMTPRERIFALSYDLPTQRLAKEIAARGFSRVPIYQKSLDNIRGILNAKALVRAAAGQPLGRPLNDLLHEPLFVPRTTPVKRLFLTFKQKKVHMAIVVSEYGKVLGLVTMDDLLAQIFGVLRDERADLQQSIPLGRMRRETPAGGAPRAGADGDGGDGDEGDGDGDGDGAESRAGSAPGIETDPGTPPPGGDEGFDPPPAPGARSIHDLDEVTPPAIDIAELRREHERGGRGS